MLPRIQYNGNNEYEFINTNMNCIDRVYVVCLAPVNGDMTLTDFEEIEDPRIEVFEALDTQMRWDSIGYMKEDNFVLKPIPGECTDYFSQFSGAVGCYLSHYRLWKRIIKTGALCTLILEDDASVSDVRNILNTDTASNPGVLLTTLVRPFHIIQLNKRIRDTSPDRFIGTESYIISLEGAKRLVHLAENSQLFNGIISTIDTFPSDIKKRIWAPVDMFIGECGNNNLSKDIRVNIAEAPRIGLKECESTITTPKCGKPYWRMSDVELDDFRGGVMYKWWSSINKRWISKSKIFEIGVKKTGTSSLGAAYRSLGYKTAGWDPVLFHEWSLTKDHDCIIKACMKYDAFQDGPWHGCDFRVLDRSFPGSKFILLERDDGSWIGSLERHESPALNVNNINTDWLQDRWVTDRDAYINEMIAFKKEKYDRIKEYFKDRPGDLLILNIFEEDNPYVRLCDFLNIEHIPSRTFPHVNSSEIS